MGVLSPPAPAGFKVAAACAISIVLQAFPAAVTAEEADPFLMCDFFGPSKSDGVAADPDEYPIDWHPHRGFDIATYLIEGVGRHADSLGNREIFAAPGMQWCSVGSGIEHAEGGGTPAGVNTTGFQLWINVPSKRKMDDPRYGTVPASALPVTVKDGVTARVLAGALDGVTGPFTTVQPVSMIDYVLAPGASLEHAVPADYDSTMVFLYNGGLASCNGSPVEKLHVVLFDATNEAQRALALTAGPAGASLMLFAGKRLKQPIAWRGPFVMTTQAELTSTIREYQTGRFPPKRVPWDYRSLSAFPPSAAAPAGGPGGAAGAK